MKKKEMIAMLLAGGQGSRLKGLTKDIAKPAVIFGGKYRIIDFALSNCSNSGIDTVGVLTQYKPLLLNSYIATGSSWGLDSVNGGINILPPYTDQYGGAWYKGTADAIYQNIEYIDFHNPEYVMIVSGDQIYKMDYSNMLKAHKEKKAELTLATIEVPWEEASRFGLVVTDENNKIIEFQEKPENPTSNKASMGVYIFDWKILRKSLIEDHNNPDSGNDFGKNVIPMLLNQKKELYTYSYKGYWRDVGTVDSYYEANMDLIENEHLLNLTDKENSIYSNNLSVQPHCIEEGGIVSNSLICDGCTIFGEVKNSILGNDIYVAKNSLIENSIILRNVKIGENVIIKKTIIGENVEVRDNVVIGSVGEDDVIKVISETI